MTFWHCNGLIILGIFRGAGFPVWGTGQGKEMFTLLRNLNTLVPGRVGWGGRVGAMLLFSWRSWCWPHWMRVAMCEDLCMLFLSKKDERTEISPHILRHRGRTQDLTVTRWWEGDAETILQLCCEQPSDRHVENIPWNKEASRQYLSDDISASAFCFYPCLGVGARFSGWGIAGFVILLVWLSVRSLSPPVGGFWTCFVSHRVTEGVSSHDSFCQMLKPYCLLLLPVALPAFVPLHVWAALVQTSPPPRSPGAEPQAAPLRAGLRTPSDAALGLCSSKYSYSVLIPPAARSRRFSESRWRVEKCVSQLSSRSVSKKRDVLAVCKIFLF